MKYEQYEDYKNLLNFKQELKRIKIRERVTAQPDGKCRLTLPKDFVAEVDALIEKYITQANLQMEHL